MTDSILFEKESNVSRVSLLPYSACTGVGVVAGAKKCQAGQHQPAGEEEEAGPDLVSDRSQALAGLARAGARSNRRPCAPQRYTFLQCCAREILCYGAALFTFLPAVQMCLVLRATVSCCTKRSRNFQCSVRARIGQCWQVVVKKTREKRGCYFILGFLRVNQIWSYGFDMYI